MTGENQSAPGMPEGQRLAKNDQPSLFHFESVPERSALHEVAPDIRRIVADNPSKMTYHGTNTYLIDTDDGVFVLDPGPADDETHLAVLLNAVRSRSGGIIVSHHHSDHSGAVPRLRSETGLKVHASRMFADDSFYPDVPLEEGDEVAGLTVLHTPGHASDHLCFGRGDGVAFTGDHIMTWSSSIVMLPDGDMAAYCQGLARFVERDDTLYLPGHGPPLADPQPYAQSLLANRETREAEILAYIGETPSDAAEIARRLYQKADPGLARAAVRNAESHLDKMRREGRAKKTGDLWRAV